MKTFVNPVSLSRRKVLRSGLAGASLVFFGSLRSPETASASPAQCGKALPASDPGFEPRLDSDTTASAGSRLADIIRRYGPELGGRESALQEEDHGRV